LAAFAKKAFLTANVNMCWQCGIWSDLHVIACFMPPLRCY
jgi:hypothetical protein